jgi:hypothetical protein
MSPKSLKEIPEDSEGTPRVILTFNAVTQREEALDALNGCKYLMLLQELDSQLRNVGKYNSKFPSKNSISKRAAQELRKWLHNSSHEMGFFLER